MMRYLPIPAALLLLSACNNEPETAPQDDDSGGARGEVLDGTISDDMLPLDTVTSQSPPENPVGEEGDAPDGEDAAMAAASDTADE